MQFRCSSQPVDVSANTMPCLAESARSSRPATHTGTRAMSALLLCLAVWMSMAPTCSRWVHPTIVSCTGFNNEQHDKQQRNLCLICPSHR